MASRIIFATLLAFGATVRASQLFNNTGTIAGWDDKPYTEFKGTVEEVTNVVYQGTTALKMTQIYDTTGVYQDRYHSEVKKNYGYKRGDTRFYGFAFRLQQDWQSSPAQSYNIAQFIANVADYKCDDYLPSVMVWVLGDKLHSRLKWGDVCNPVGPVNNNTQVTVTPGVWHKIVLHVKWESDDTGFFKMWYDGTKVAEVFNHPTTYTDGRAFEFRVGLYANGWHDDKGMKGTQPERKVWFDEIAAGDAFSDADPDQW